MTQATVSDLAFPERTRGAERVTVAAISVLAGSLLIALSARLFVPIPGTPIPVTLQTFAVLLVGFVLGPRLGAAAATLYLLESLAAPGLFTASGRIALTGGYIVGFIPAAWIAGHLFRRGFGRGVTRAVLAMIPAQLVVFAIGVPWFAVASGQSVEGALAMGLMPFVVVELGKIVSSAIMMRGVSEAAERFEASLGT